MIKKYDIKNNIFFIEFIKNTGKKHAIYYNLLIKLITRKFSITASILVGIFNVLRKILTKNVIKKNITPRTANSPRLFP